jgi:hypothetical protein
MYGSEAKVGQGFFNVLGGACRATTLYLSILPLLLVQSLSFFVC